MTIDAPAPSQIPELRSLWQEAFGDTDEYLDIFFQTAYSPNRCRCLTENGQVAAALYWFDCTHQGDRIAYIYAVATRKGFRHRGYSRQLLENTHRHLQEEGYVGAILTPASDDLFRFYEKIGYKPGTSIADRTVKPGYVSTTVEPISCEDYDIFRSIRLPAGSVLMDDTTMRFLRTQVQFYKGKGFILCGSVEDGVLTTQEYLGDMELAPRILKALKLKEGRFRGPGQDHPFTMYLPLREGEFPQYFGLPMD